MKTKAIALTIFTGLLAVTSLRAADAKPLVNEKDQVSYALGQFYGNDWKRREIQATDLNLEQFVKSLTGALNGDKPTMTETELNDVFKKFQQDLTTRQQEKRKALAEKNKTAGEAFLAANKAKPGVKTFESGLQYKVLTEGSGDSPKAEDTCVVKYRGSLIDGTEFDSSDKAPGGTASFPANRVIPGWTEALTHMKPGAKWQLVIPANLAYGERGQGGTIGPNATLLFDVELVSFTNPPPPPPPPAPLTSDIIKVPSLDEMKKGAKIETIKAEDVEKLQKEKEKK